MKSGVSKDGILELDRISPEETIFVKEDIKIRVKRLIQKVD